jgi:MFS family permease
MKKNTALFIGTIIFVILFYKQEVALNLSIFCLLIWGMIFSMIPKKNHTKHFWLLSVALFISIAGFAWYGDFSSFIPLFFSLIFFIIKSFYPKLNILAIPFVMLISGATSPIRILLINRWLKLSGKTYFNFWKKTFLFVVVPLFFTGIFLALYSVVSSRFASYLNFNWDFENFLIIFGLSVLGFFFMFNFVHLYFPRMVAKENFRLKENFSNDSQNNFLKKSSSNHSYFLRRSGEITLLILNLILVFFIFVYASESLRNVMPEVSYSSEVHERVYVLIASIAVAVAIIMIYFQSKSNF